MPQTTRPSFEPESVPPGAENIQDGSNRTWVAVIQCPAHFPVELVRLSGHSGVHTAKQILVSKFESVMVNLIYHPELTVDLILRAEVEEPDPDAAEGAGTLHTSADSEYQINGYCQLRKLRRRLLPKVPQRDAPLSQDCILYRAEEGLEVQMASLFPILSPGQRIPHYHPKVNAIAFRYISSVNGAQNSLRIDVVPRDDAPITRTSRLFKTCYTLLDLISKHGWGLLTGYQKRMHHDTVISKESYQDFYQIMKEKHKGLKDTWAESTDATKNVFEDIGIATFLMLLWKDTYPAPQVNGKEVWGRPPGGFIDMGCGAGLLVHILTEEGYDGIGLDIRSRKSWNLYPEETRNKLQVYTFDPLASGFLSDTLFKPGVFLIGNHADELSPWLPIITALVEEAAYLSIPCCPWALDQRFHRNSTSFPLISSEDIELTKRLGATSKSTYGAYLVYLAGLSRECGFEGEYEALRIPTTRNWSIIGRTRLEGEGQRRARDIHSKIVERDFFRARQGVNSNH